VFILAMQLLYITVERLVTENTEKDFSLLWGNVLFGFANWKRKKNFSKTWSGQSARFL